MKGEGSEKGGGHLNNSYQSCIGTISCLCDTLLGRGIRSCRLRALPWGIDYLQPRWAIVRDDGSGMSCI